MTVARDRAQPEELRLQATHWLGVSDAAEELWILYQEEPSFELKRQILHGLLLSEDMDKLNLIARNPAEPAELRQAAIHNLGLIGDQSRGVLLEIYSNESEREIRNQILHALFLQDASRELIDIAKKETDLELRKQAVHWISLIDSDEAKAFLLEILRR